MKETRFIGQNKQKWQEAETLLESPVKDPEKLGNLFIQIVDDLSYSRTYFPNRSVRVYLNKIARQYFSIIYSHKKEKHNQFKLFWLDELPQIIIYSRRELLVSFIVFVLALSIGILSSSKDPQFVATILGDSYVTMTEKNIASGDPMAVYKQSNQIDMFLGITLNNLMVAFRTYVLGIFLGIGTLASLLSNGIMVGCFQYYFIEQGLLVESASTIWLHGTLEISSIILAGGAGLTLARGLIFPGTYSRLQSLQISGIRSLKFMLGITPIFILAAIIESFLTRYTDAPTLLKVFLIVLSALFIIGYFVVYPWLKSKSGFTVPLKEIRIQPSPIQSANFTMIKNDAEILKDTFQFYSRNQATILFWVLLVSLGMSTVSFFIKEEAFILVENEWWITLFSDMLFVLDMPSPEFIFLNSLGTSIILYRVMKLVEGEFKKTSFIPDAKSFVQIFVLMIVLYAAIYWGLLGIIFALGAYGLLIFIGYVVVTEQTNLITAIARGWELYGKNNNQGLTLQFIILPMIFSFLLLLSAPLLYMHISVLQWNFVADDIWSQNAIHFLELFIKTFSFYLVLPIVVAGFCFLHYSQDEVSTASSLKESITGMGMRNSKRKK